jgi:hypothetical protein
MTSVNTGLNPYASYGTAYARTAAAAAQPSLANTLAANEAASTAPDAATNLTLSDAARAALATNSSNKTIAGVVADTRTALDGLYRAAKVTGPLATDGSQTVDL